MQPRSRIASQPNGDKNARAGEQSPVISGVERRPRVAIVCTGLGRIRRGFETLAADLFDELRQTVGLDVVVYKGGGVAGPAEIVVPNIHRSSALNSLLCRLFGASKSLYIEYLSFCCSLGPLLLWRPAEVIYTLEPPIYKFLLKWRKLTRQKFALIHSTSGQLADIPAGERCFIHHCTPCYVPKADQLSFARSSQFIIPQFLRFESIPAPMSQEQRGEIRDRLNLPRDRPIVLSVGSLDTSVKRMDYIVREVANIRSGRKLPFLVMLGQQGPETPIVKDLAEQQLGASNFIMRTVSREELWDFYQAANVFVLASLREGFGFVYVEALAAGLPVIAHDYDVAHYVLDDQGLYADLTQQGALSALLMSTLGSSTAQLNGDARRKYAEHRFAWQAVADDYVEMFRAAASV